jgi:peptidoglycan hydrolase-like protein with peptidoglycan-binding domain
VGVELHRLTLKAAIDKWSGHNSPAAYVAYLEKNTGISVSTKVTRQFLASDAGWKLLKAQSRWEAGKPIPMTDAEWQEAQGLVFGNAAPKSTAAKNVAAPTASVSADVLRVQRYLAKLGYHEVGEADGLMGGRTKGAITAFANDRHIETDAAVTPALLSEIDKAVIEGWSRPIAPKRAYTTEQQLAPKVEAVKQNAWSRFWSKLLAVPSTVGGVAYGIVQNVPAANETAAPYIGTAKEYLSDVPGWVWMLIVAAVGFAIWRSTNKSTAATVADYQTGRLN